MMRMRNMLAVVATALLLASFSRAQEPIKFARTPDISPDGRLVAFSYLGDIWVVESIGGIARPVTMHEAHEINPVFSPDGRAIAFSSNRNGSYDVFTTSVEGGRPTRLTFDSANDMVTDWSADGKQILFASTRSTNFPRNFQLYTVPVTGGRVQHVRVTEGKEAVFSPDCQHIAYVRGPGTWYRKGYRGSSNDDVWICDTDGSHNTRLTSFDGQDTSPMWSPDGRYVYYVSEYFSKPGEPANVVRKKVGTNEKPEQVTFHQDDSVRLARMSRDGKWIVYECGADIWVTGTEPGARPRKLAIEVHADDKANTERRLSYTNNGMSEFALSHDEKHVAFVVHGQLFLMPASGGKATRLTESTAYDHAPTWSPDSKKIVFSSDRNGHEDLYLLEPDDPENPTLVKAHKFKVRPLTSTPEAEEAVSFSPDGKHIAFIRAGKLFLMEPDGSGQKVLVNDVQVFDYDWSPDGKWIVYARMNGSLASELYIIPTDGRAKGSGKNITRYATYNGDVTWSTNGKKIGFISQRRNHVGMYVMSLEKPAAVGAKSTRGVHIDWDDLHLRVEQAGPLPAEEGAISPGGTLVAFRSVGGLWVAGANGSSLRRLVTVSNPQQIQWSRRQTEAIWFRDGSGALHLTRVNGGDTTVPFRVKLTVRRNEEFREMFEQSWRALRERFYDPKFHGADWYAVRKKYQPLVKHVTMKEDLYALISLMMGELNASHLGIMGLQSTPDETTADLGLIFDETYKGPGLKIAEILKRGPADKRGLNLKAGDVITAIDRTPLKAASNISMLLNDKVGETVFLDVTSNPKADPKKDKNAFRHVEIQAVSRGKIYPLMYERWVEHNAKRVAELSHGRLGYIHIPSMDEAGLDRFVRALYSDNFDKDAIVLDVRYNGGGFTHDQVLNYLIGHEHTVFRQRNGGQGSVLRSFDRKWSKPLVLLINNRSYSDAEIFPSAFRTLGLGKLVGQSTGGHVIGTSAIRLIDGSIFRIPQIGVFTIKGVDMEEHGVRPDVVIDDSPDQEQRGEDPQLDAAVRVLQTDVLAWKQKHHALGAPPPTVQASGGTDKPRSVLMPLVK